MKSTDAPSKQAVPFGTNGPREAITPTTPSGSNQASYDQGFPPITMTLKSAGGLPPKGQDMNQILFEQSSFNRYFAAGGGYVYDSTFSTAISGYPLGARIPNSTGNGFWVNTTQDNSTNPENTTAALTGWIPDNSYGVTNISGLAAASQTIGTLAASKDRIVLSGTLTANINIVVPAWVKRWEIINNCTGSFSATIKTPSGTGVAVPASSNAFVFGDGTNIVTSLPPGLLIGVTVISVTGTFTPKSYTRSMIVECVGGGGGGGGLTAPGASGHSVTGGGGGGGYAMSMVSPVSSSYSATIGTPGSGGTAGVAGGSGGVTSFGAVCVAGGAGGGNASTTTESTTSAIIGIAGIPGYGTVGNVILSAGERGETGIGTANGNLGGGGGSSKAGRGGVRIGAAAGNANNGNAGLGYGAGGGGGAAAAITTGAVGGSGTAGVIFVWEYS